MWYDIHPPYKISCSSLLSNVKEEQRKVLGIQRTYCKSKPKRMREAFAGVLEIVGALTGAVADPLR